MRQNTRYILLAVLAAILAAVAAPAQETAASGGTTAEAFPNDYCLDCHGDRGLTSDAGRSMFADDRALARSEHAGMSCIACHDAADADYEDVPHAATHKPVGCINCHQRTGFVWREYFHNMMPEGSQGDIPDCQDCHGAPHDARLLKSMEIVCTRCHEEVAAEYQQSYHSRKYSEDTRR
ncbi:MAG: hypothetical protein GY953_12575, partial [bacterium]|nr:hypothetical protein [bacterium]